jgi:hypothetical protein
MIVVNYSVAERYEPVTEYFQPYHENEWVAGKFGAFIGENDKTYNQPPEVIRLLTVEQLVEHCEIHNKTPVEIILSYNKKGFPDIKRIYAVKELNADYVLDGDYIPF